MAVSYTIDSAAELQPEGACKLLTRLSDFSRTAQGIRAPDLHVWVGKPTALKISIIEEAFAFVPKLEVDFRIDSLGDGQAALDRILRATCAFLLETTEDVSLLFNGEQVVMTRLRGRLLLNTRPGFWTEARLNLMPQPHSFSDPLTL
jgi:hypothetical protein